MTFWTGRVVDVERVSDTAVPQPGEVVVGVDEEPGCAAAVAWAAGEARSRGVPLRLVHVWSWGMLNPDVPAEKRAVEGAVAARIEPVLDRLRALARLNGADPVRTELVEGYPADVLARTEACLVVIGSHHLRGVGRAVLGSCSRALAARASVPCVVVNSAPDAEDRDAAVVVGLSAHVADSTASADDRLLAFAFDVARRRHRRVQAVCCWDPPLGNHTLPPPETAQEGAREQLRRWQERYRDVTASVTVVRGHPVETLVEASDHQALLVVGRSKQRLHLGQFLGSTCLGVVRNSSCPVAVLPPELPRGGAAAR